MNSEINMSGLLILAVAVIGAPLIIRALLELEKYVSKKSENASKAPVATH